MRSVVNNLTVNNFIAILVGSESSIFVYLLLLIPLLHFCIGFVSLIIASFLHCSTYSYNTLAVVDLSCSEKQEQKEKNQLLSPLRKSDPENKQRTDSKNEGCTMLWIRISELE